MSLVQEVKSAVKTVVSPEYRKLMSERQAKRTFNAKYDQHRTDLRTWADEESRIMVEIKSGRLTTMALDEVHAKQAATQRALQQIQENKSWLKSNCPDEELKRKYRKAVEKRTVVLIAKGKSSERVSPEQERLKRLETAHQSLLAGWEANKHKADQFSKAEAERRIKIDARELENQRRDVAELLEEVADLERQRVALDAELESIRAAMILA